MELVSIDRCAARPPGLEASGEPFVKVVEWLLQVATHPPAAENIALPALQRRFPDCPMGVLSALVDYCAGPSMRLAVDGSSSSSGPGPRRLAFDPRPWTGTEILALLKAVGVHGDDWQVVAQAVRTRTPQDCLVYFLRLPVTDPFLDAAAVMAKHGEATPGKSVVRGPEQSSMGLLAAVADPFVVETATRAVLGRLSTASAPGVRSESQRPVSSTSVSTQGPRMLLPDPVDLRVAAGVALGVRNGAAATGAPGDSSIRPAEGISLHLGRLHQQMADLQKLDELLGRERARLAVLQAEVRAMEADNLRHDTGRGGQ